MFGRGSLKLPIALGVVLIILVTAVTVGWVLLAVFGALADERYGPLYWTLLAVGASVLGLVLLGIVLYLTLSIKAANLTRRQSNFIDSVTHELKSPVASLKLYLQTLNRRQVSETQREQFHCFMVEDVERLDDLINRLLEVARIEHHAPPKENEPVELSALIADCVVEACLRHHVSPDVVRLELTPCTADGPREYFEIVFRNLIDNAVKYAGDDPLVEIQLSYVEEGRAVVTIADNGPGVPRAQRKKIFHRFYRAGDELERKKTGTGLGLYLVRLLIRRLRWTIRLRDAALGGAEFEVQLPASPVPAPADPSEAARQAGAA